MPSLATVSPFSSRLSSFWLNFFILAVAFVLATLLHDSPGAPSPETTPVNASDPSPDLTPLAFDDNENPVVVEGATESSFTERILGLCT